MKKQVLKPLNRAVESNGFSILQRRLPLGIGERFPAIMERCPISPAGRSRKMSILRSSRRGFTLIELLITIGITLVLGAVAMSLLPGLSKRSKNIRCISNLKTLGQAVLIYANENGGNAMTAYDGTSLWYMHLTKGGYLDRHAREKVLTCPSFAPYHYSDKGQNNMYTYGLRRWGAAVGTTNPAWSLGKHSRPANFVLLADSYKAQTKHQFYYITVPDSKTGSPEQIHLRHGGRGNIFFADGSIRSLSGDEILNLDDGWTAKAIQEQENPQ